MPDYKAHSEVYESAFCRSKNNFRESSETYILNNSCCIVHLNFLYIALELAVHLNDWL